MYQHELCVGGNPLVIWVKADLKINDLVTEKSNKFFFKLLTAYK